MLISVIEISSSCCKRLLAAYVDNIAERTFATITYHSFHLSESLVKISHRPPIHIYELGHLRNIMISDYDAFSVWINEISSTHMEPWRSAYCCQDFIIEETNIWDGQRRSTNIISITPCRSYPLFLWNIAGWKFSLHWTTRCTTPRITKDIS